MGPEHRSSVVAPLGRPCAMVHNVMLDWKYNKEKVNCSINLVKWVKTDENSLHWAIAVKNEKSEGKSGIISKKSYIKDLMINTSCPP